MVVSVYVKLCSFFFLLLSILKMIFHDDKLTCSVVKCKQEDEIIIELVNKYGPKKWSTIAQHLPGRIGKQCRER